MACGFSAGINFRVALIGPPTKSHLRRFVYTDADIPGLIEGERKRERKRERERERERERTDTSNERPSFATREEAWPLLQLCAK
jgi:hypothetical protein